MTQADTTKASPYVSNEVWAGFLRGGPEHFKFGDPWEWFAPYRSHPTKPGVAWVGFGTPENTKAFREIGRALADIGYGEFGWAKRDKGGRMVWRQFDCRTGRPTHREILEI